MSEDYLFSCYGLKCISQIHAFKSYPLVSQCVLVASVMSKSLRPNGLYLVRLLFTWESPGKNTRVEN